MLIVNETTCEQVIGFEDAFKAVESVFAAMASGDAYNFPVVREAIGHADALYGFKSGFDRKGLVLGVKGGGYWPHNMEKNLTNHQSTVCLFDPDTGQLSALVGGNYLTAVRTAASSSVSIAHLSRKDSRVLGMVGAGHQATFQLKSALKQRSFDKVVGWNIVPEDLTRLADIATGAGCKFESLSREDLCAQSDVIITITSAHEPLLMLDWLKPGTHIACMGTDTRGKQELDPVIFSNASVFTDEVAQAVSIGECQHAFADGSLKESAITPVGAVINKDHFGRAHDNDITVFDGTGVALQDLAVASTVVELARQSGQFESVSLL